VTSLPGRIQLLTQICELIPFLHVYVTENNFLFNSLRCNKIGCLCLNLCHITNVEGNLLFLLKFYIY
jgi:hypothetical protein